MLEDSGFSLDNLIGEEVRHLRLSRGLTQGELAAAIGVSPHKVQSYELGRTGLSVERLIGIAEVLHVDPCHFLRVRHRSTAVETLTRAPSFPGSGSELLPVDSLVLIEKIRRIRDNETRLQVIGIISRLVDCLIATNDIENP